VDEVRLTIPPEPGFYPVAHLVLSGLASRLELTLDRIDDLELAIDTLLERARSDEVTVALRLRGNTLETVVGPFDGELRPELEPPASGVGVRRILEATVDEVSLDEREGALWVTVRQQGVKRA
jgi:hypothetical protein